MILNYHFLFKLKITFFKKFTLLFTHQTPAKKNNSFKSIGGFLKKNVQK